MASHEHSRRKIALLVEYDGTEFVGWQRQASGRTAQQTLEEALSDLTGEDGTRVMAAGRTDRGVHARGQVVCLETERDWAADVFRRALPERLPDDLGVRAAAEVPREFNPRGDAILRTYTYRVWNRRTAPIIDRRQWTHARAPMNFEWVRAASERLVGDHDFRGFRSAQCDAERTALTIQRLEWTRAGEGLWVMEIASRSFLRHMVRTVVGTLFEIGRGAMEPEMIDRILETGDRGLAGATARPEGLTLERVDYPFSIFPDVEQPRRRGGGFL